MKTLIAVLEDLWSFIVAEIFGQPAVINSVPAATNSVERALQVRPPTPLATPISTPITPPTPVRKPGGSEPMTLRVAVAEAPLFSSPVAAFDGVIKLLPFGSTLVYRQRQNRWIEVDVDNVRGWVLSDSLSEEHVMPQFVSGEFYGPDHEVTKKVRAFIQNEFFGAELLSPLQDVEYVSYRLRRKGKRIPWGLERPRTPGAWQRLLRGKRGVHIGISPKTDTIMEVINEDETGHVAFVEAVFPSQAILLSSVGHNESGYFRGETLEREEWRELKPIFIDVG